MVPPVMLGLGFLLMRKVPWKSNWVCSQDDRDRKAEALSDSSICSSAAVLSKFQMMGGLHGAAFTRLFLNIGQPFYGCFRMAILVLQPVSTGLSDRLQPLLAPTVLELFPSRDVVFDCGRS